MKGLQENLLETVVADGLKAEAQAQAEARRSSSAYARWFIVVLAMVAFVGFIDRVIVATLGPAIKRDLAISDTQFGLLTGLAFALLYTSAGIPIARLADRHNRVRLLSGAIALWSLMTALSGAAVNFTQMLLLRFGVGIGEAAANPCTMSLIADRFPRNRRAGALAIVALGASLGSLVGGFGGGWLGEHYSWRQAFLFLGLPGLLLAAIVLLTLREEPRGQFDPPQAAPDIAPSFMELLRLVSHKPAFLNMAMGCGLTSFVNYGVFLFLPTYFGRAFDMGMAKAGLLFGLVTSISNAIGTLGGGLGAQWAGRTDRRWYAWLPAICLTVTAPIYMFGLAMPRWEVALPIVAAAATLAFTFYAPTFAATQNMVEPRMRASAAAILIFFQNLIGMGLGPLFVGFMSDFYASRAFGEGYATICARSVGQTVAAACAQAHAAGIRYAMATCAAFLFWAALHFFLAARTIRRDGA